MSKFFARRILLFELNVCGVLTSVLTFSIQQLLFHAKPAYAVSTNAEFALGPTAGPVGLLMFLPSKVRTPRLCTNNTLGALGNP